MKTKHTPGEWELYEDEHQTDITVDNCSLAVAFLPTLLKDTESNKHLIKHAPDMLAMLQHVKGYLGSDQRYLVEALIKKATGDE